MPGRHSSFGLSMIVVSIISTGAGSVAVSARPSLPAASATSGEAGDDFVLPRHDALHLGERGRGREHGHEEQAAFVERRHELAAHAGDEPLQRGHAVELRDDRSRQAPEHDLREREQAARRWRARSCDGSAPSRAPARRCAGGSASRSFRPRGETARARGSCRAPARRDREQRRADHREGLREGERVEEFPLLPRAARRPARTRG